MAKPIVQIKINRGVQMPEHFEVILRSITSFGLLLIGTRILGKQTIAKMTMFDFVAAITLGAISANLAFNTSIKALHTIIAIITYIIIIISIAFFSLKSRKGRKFLAGDPTIVIQNGNILEK